MKTKIFSIESQKENFDKIPMNEIENMVGNIEPNRKGDKIVWDVVLANGDGFECKSQETAQIIAGIEEIKVMLMENR